MKTALRQQDGIKKNEFEIVLIIAQKEGKKTAEMSEETRQLLAQCVQAEAGNQSLDGKRMVVDVILNRAADPDFPDRIEEVILQKNQFAVVSNGSLYEVVPDADTLEAVRMETEEIGWTGLFYFTAEGFGEYGKPWKKVGDHYFSTK